MKNEKNRRGFTLIELLVVVSIIVILIAILVPALDSAMYEASFAKCGAHQSGVAKSIVQYAADNKQFYPPRKAYEYFQYLAGSQTSGGVGYRSYWVLGTIAVSDSVNGTQDTASGGVAGNRHDDRPYYKGYMDLKLLNEPFCDEIPFDDAETYADGVYVTAPFELYWGFSFSGYGKMGKYGQALVYDNASTGKKHRWNILLSDRAMWFGRAQSSHPDDSGRLELNTERGETIYVGTGTTFQAYASRWLAAQSPQSEAQFTETMGGMDYNYAYDDGSVRGIRDIKNGVADERIAKAPVFKADTDISARYRLMPSNDK